MRLKHILNKKWILIISTFYTHSLLVCYAGLTQTKIFTKVTSFTVPTIHRATLTESTKGAAATEAGTSNADSITMVFGFNNPIVVTDKTTGMDIKINYNYALSVDFEDVIAVGTETLIKNNLVGTNPKRIRLLGAGPFGIAFVPNEGGSTD